MAAAQVACWRLGESGCFWGRREVGGGGRRWVRWSSREWESRAQSAFSSLSSTSSTRSLSLSLSLSRSLCPHHQHQRWPPSTSSRAESLNFIHSVVADKISNAKKSCFPISQQSLHMHVWAVWGILHGSSASSSSRTKGSLLLVLKVFTVVTETCLYAGSNCCTCESELILYGATDGFLFPLYWPDYLDWDDDKQGYSAHG